ncbi:hypothetical protein K1719_047095 [Acacia pycnantha]|nr:hypothetical protein K1719_047095 [Acacia pycnantha]
MGSRFAVLAKDAGEGAIRRAVSQGLERNGAVEGVEKGQQEGVENSKVEVVEDSSNPYSKYKNARFDPRNHIAIHHLYSLVHQKIKNTNRSTPDKKTNLSPIIVICDQIFNPAYHRGRRFRVAVTSTVSRKEKQV